MEISHIAIAGLSVLDIGVLTLVYWFDRKYYIPSIPLREQSAPDNFFVNKSFDEPLTRFMLSKAGTLLISLVFMGIIALSLKNVRG